MTDLDVLVRYEGGICQRKARDEFFSISPAAFACFCTGDDVHLFYYQGYLVTFNHIVALFSGFQVDVNIQFIFMVTAGLSAMPKTPIPLQALLAAPLALSRGSMAMCCTGAPATTEALMSLPPLPPVIGSSVQPMTTWTSARPMSLLAALLHICSSNFFQMEREEFVPQRVFGSDAGNVTCYIKQTVPPSWCFIDLQYTRCFMKPLLDLLWQSCDAYLRATWTPSISSRNLADPYLVHFVHKMRRRNFEVWLFIHDVRRKMDLAAQDGRLRAKDFLHMLHCDKKKC